MPNGAAVTNEVLHLDKQRGNLGSNKKSIIPRSSLPHHGPDIQDYGQWNRRQGQIPRGAISWGPKSNSISSELLPAYDISSAWGTSTNTNLRPSNQCSRPRLPTPSPFLMRMEKAWKKCDQSGSWVQIQGVGQKVADWVYYLHLGSTDEFYFENSTDTPFFHSMIMARRQGTYFQNIPPSARRSFWNTQERGMDAYTVEHEGAKMQAVSFKHQLF